MADILEFLVTIMEIYILGKCMDFINMDKEYK
jgi:hypothetical protein